MTQTTTVSIRIPTDRLAALRSMAELAGMPISTFINHWLTASEEPMRWMAMKISQAKTAPAETLNAINRLADKLEDTKALDLLVDEGVIEPEKAEEARAKIADAKRAQIRVVPLQPTPLEAAIDGNTPRK